MKNKGIRSGLLAAGYIALVASILYYGQSQAPTEDTPLVIMSMLSLLVLSVSTMGWLFIAQPLIEYFDGRKKEAVILFGWTLGTFGAIVTVLFFLLIFINPAL
jgi:hypothetical protein